MERDIYICLTEYNRAILKSYLEMYIIERNWYHFAPHIKHATEDRDRFFKRSRHFRKPCEEEVPYGMSLDTTLAKPVLKKLAHLISVSSESRYRAPHIARWQYPKLISQLSGTPS